MRITLRRILVGLLVAAVPVGLVAAVTVPNAFSNDTVADASAVNANFTALATAVDALRTQLDGVKRDCPGFGTQTYSAATATWSVCPTAWNCTTSPTHAGCVSSSAYATCLAIRSDTAFNGGDATYFIDPDGASGNAPFPVHCDMANGGWTRLGRFNGTTDDLTLSAASALTIPFKEARLSLNDSGSVKIISCSDTPAAGNLQTTATDRACPNGSGWYIRFKVSNPVSTWANYGFYRGALTANNGGCSWGTVTEVWGRHHSPSIGTCTGLGLGQQYETNQAFGASYLFMYIR